MLQRQTKSRSAVWQRDSGEQDLAFHRAGRERSEQDALPRRHYYEEANDPIYVADSSDQDKIVTSRCAETEEGLKRPKKTNRWQRRLEAHLVQYIDRVVDEEKSIS